MISDKQLVIYEKVKNSFSEIKAEEDNSLINHYDELFVNIKASETIRTFGPYIFIGRKGVGKTALIENFKATAETTAKLKYKVNIDIIADQNHSYALYNFYYKKFAGIHKKVGTDIQDFIDIQALFSATWSAAIQVAIMLNLVSKHEEILKGNFSNEMNVVKEYLEKTLHFESLSDINNSKSHVQSLLPIFFDIIETKIDSLVNGKYTIGVIISKFTSWFNQMIKSNLIKKKAWTSLQNILQESQINILITLDRYDDYVDQMIQKLDDDTSVAKQIKGAPVDPDHDIKERAGIIVFNRGMLRGLLLATKEIRKFDSFNLVSFALAIPHDRYAELKLREAATINTKIIEHIEWNPLYLLEYFVKRSIFVVSEKCEIKSINDLINEYKNLLRLFSISEFLPHNHVKATKEDMFLYIVRHSMWRPRDLQRYIKKIFEFLSNRSDITKNEQLFMCEIRDAVKEMSKEIVSDEFLLEYRVEYPNLESVISRFRHAPNIMTDEELRARLGKSRISLNYSNMSTDDIIPRLYNIGFLGIRSRGNVQESSCIKQNNQSVKYKFYYNSERKELDTKYGRGTSLSELEDWVIHPMFYYTLENIIDTKYVVHEMNWDYIVSNYANNYRPPHK